MRTAHAVRQARRVRPVHRRLRPRRVRRMRRYGPAGHVRRVPRASGGAGAGRRPTVLTVVPVLALALLAAPLATGPTWRSADLIAAQAVETSRADDAILLTANALLGGLTAGIGSAVRGGSFDDAFVRGLLGGGVVFAGKKLAVQRAPGAGLAGRQVAAVGASIIRNAADRRPMMQRLIVPVGPVRLYVRTDSVASLRAKVDLTSAATLVWAIAAPRWEFDVAETLGAGTPVFHERMDHRPDRDRVASVLGGNVLLGRRAGRFPPDPGAAFAHERIHVLQLDHLFTTLADPLEDWVVPKLPGGAFVHRYADINTTILLLSPLVLAIDEWQRRPWEIEANLLSGLEAPHGRRF